MLRSLYKRIVNRIQKILNYTKEEFEKIQKKFIQKTNFKSTKEVYTKEK